MERRHEAGARGGRPARGATVRPMSDAKLGSSDRPLRVAVVGSGPAGFYTADDLLKKKDLTVEVDVFDRLPAPYGLVRYGVAPDHQKIKSVIKQFEKTTTDARFRFLGNVTVGRDVTHEELVARYDQVVYSVGAETDRRMNIPGEDLAGSHPATEFVWWYNGHPDHRHHHFDLSAKRAVVVGVGDVALDIARVMLRSRDELGRTDIASHAFDALRESRVEEVVCLGRRGAGQAAFAQKELKDVAALSDIDVIIDPAQTAEALSSGDQLDSMGQRKLEYLHALAQQGPTGKPKRLVFRFLASPVELVGQEGHVTGMNVERNELVRGSDGSVKPKGTGDVTLLDTRCVFRSVGYHGVALAGVPFDSKGGVIPNDDGRVLDGVGGKPLPGVYACGWIKRGPTGVIGTNKTDAVATVRRMLEDVEGKMVPVERDRSRAAIDELLRARGVRVVTTADWQTLDRLEVEAGAARGKVREKFTSIEAMLAALDGASGG